MEAANKLGDRLGTRLVYNWATKVVQQLGYILKYYIVDKNPWAKALWVLSTLMHSHIALVHCCITINALSYELLDANVHGGD